MKLPRKKVKGDSQLLLADDSAAKEDDDLPRLVFHEGVIKELADKVNEFVSGVYATKKKLRGEKRITTVYKYVSALLEKGASETVLKAMKPLPGKSSEKSPMHPEDRRKVFSKCNSNLNWFDAELLIFSFPVGLSCQAWSIDSRYKGVKGKALLDDEIDKAIRWKLNYMDKT